MARSKGISIPVKLETRASQKALSELTKSINKSIGKITSANKHLTRATNEATKSLGKQNAILKRENVTLNKNTKAWKRNTKEIKRSESAQKRITSATNKTGKSLNNIKGLMVRGGVWGTLAVGVIFATKSMISATKEMETLEIQFKTLLGSTGKAKERMEELAEFTAKTPFELGEVSKASRILETLTKGALSTGEGLRLVGDASATTGSDFENLAMWVGRAYDGLQSNRPVGEAMMRMQELGLVSGEARNKIEQLQKQARGKDAWLVMKAELERSKGGMESLSKTAVGLESTTRDLTKEMWRNVDASIGVSSAYKTLLSWGIQILNNVNDNIEAERKLAKIREDTKQADILKAISRRALIQRQIALDEANGIKTNIQHTKQLGMLNRTIQKFAVKHGMDENQLTERSQKASIRVWEALKNVNGQAKWAVDLANQKLVAYNKQHKAIKKINDEANKEPGGKKKSKATPKPSAGKNPVDDLVASTKLWKSEVNQVMNKLERPKDDGFKTWGDDLIRSLQSVKFDPTKLIKSDSKLFEKLFEEDTKFRQKFFEARAEFTKNLASTETKIVMEQLRKRREMESELFEIDKIEREQRTGFILADAEMKANAQLEILGVQFERERAMYDKHGKDTTKLQARYEQKRARIMASTNKFQVDSVARAGDDILGNMKHIFGETKELAIAQATLKGIQAMVNSFEFGTRLGGPVLGGVMAGVSATATGFQISKMGSQNFATGGMPTGQNANVIMNERGQESILNASATARLGRDNINKLNRGQDTQNEGGNTRPADMKIVYNPTINITGSGNSSDLLSILDEDKERFGNMISDAYKRGFVNT